MHFVCKLDKNLYRCVTDDIATDEVIITEERIAHINERHPGDFETFAPLFPDIINNPDCILEGNISHTLLLLKEIRQENRPVKLILRLKTSTDPTDYKNSIITFTRTDRKEWLRLLNKKKVLYRKTP